MLDGVSFEAFPGTLVGIVGENGSGKSTLLKILAGILPPTGGSVTLRGPLGYCPQQAVLNEALTVLQHLEYFAAACHLDGTEYARALVDRLGFTRSLDQPVRALSAGTQQKLNLTLALMHQPTILHHDEPYQGFDWETYLWFWVLADHLRKQGRCLVVISHLIYDKTRFDSICELRDGRLHPERPSVDSAAGGAA